MWEEANVPLVQMAVRPGPHSTMPIEEEAQSMALIRITDADDSAAAKS